MNKDSEPKRELYPYQTTVPFSSDGHDHAVNAIKDLKGNVNILDDIKTEIGNDTIYRTTIGAISKKSLADFWGKFADLSGRRSIKITPGPQPLSDPDLGKYKKRI